MQDIKELSNILIALNAFELVQIILQTIKQSSANYFTSY